MEKITDWFEHWFDTKYYHLLYDHRDEKEAEFFMKNLILFLRLKKGARILDLPCGKGRHSVFLNSEGFNVVGADLSKNSIDFAKKFENESLLFRVHDMRDEIKNKYKAIFNLFTSFGYFNDEDTNIKVFKNFKNALETEGYIVIDFLNIIKIKHHLIKEEIFNKNGIEFQIKRSIQDEFLIKNISFEADGKKHHYTEKVQYLTLEKFRNFAEKSQLCIKHVFGNYDLKPFDKNSSDRLIIILQ
jgi:cyclopropane fatty-acyl-phospholipid synthase-like methyltransferase